MATKLAPTSAKRFQLILNAAIAYGRMPLDGELGIATATVVGMIAAEHPEAPTKLIVLACETFRQEQAQILNATSA